MAFRFKAGESVSEGVKRVVLEELSSAAGGLSDDGQHKRRETIHEARKSIKKVRGVLKLVRPELGRIYREENTKLRDMGRQLSAFRDADAIIETFDAVLERYHEQLRADSLGSIRKMLEQTKREHEQAGDLGKLMATAARVLRATMKGVSQWPLKRDGFDALAGGLESTYRDGRAAMRLAESKNRAEHYHEWRKRAKDHWYHVRLLESLWTEVMQARENGLHDLETWLGDDHNLVVLCEQIASDPDRYGGEQDVKLFVALAAEHQKELREKSLSLGQRVYEEKPKAFVGNLEKLWDAWQHQPDAMKQDQKQRREVAKKPAAKATSSARAKSGAA